MNRGLLNVLTALSLLIFLCCAAASIRARRATDYVDVLATVNPPGTYRNFELCNRVRVVSLRCVLVTRPRSTSTVSHTRATRSSADSTFAVPNGRVRLPGLRVFATPGAWEIYVGHWLISVLAAPLPCLVLFRWVGRSRRRSEGKCAACGYDLRASGQRCPECGAAVESSPPAGAGVAG